MDNIYFFLGCVHSLVHPTIIYILLYGEHILLSGLRAFFGPHGIYYMQKTKKYDAKKERPRSIHSIQKHVFTLNLSR